MVILTLLQTTEINGQLQMHTTLSRRCRQPSVCPLVGGHSRSLFLGRMMTQAEGIRQIVYVIKPGPRLVGVTRVVL